MNQINHSNTAKARILGFNVAQELNTEELNKVSGGRMALETYTANSPSGSFPTGIGGMTYTVDHD